MLPRVITSGKIVGMTNDGRFALLSDAGGSQVMTLFKTELRLRWLALHLMETVRLRLGPRNFGERFDHRLSDYYPLQKEHSRAIKKVPAKFINYSLTHHPLTQCLDTSRRMFHEDVKSTVISLLRNPYFRRRNNSVGIYATR